MFRGAYDRRVPNTFDSQCPPFEARAVRHPEGPITFDLYRGKELMHKNIHDPEPPKGVGAGRWVYLRTASGMGGD